MAAATDYAHLHRRISREMALHGLRQYAPIYAKLLVAPLRRIYAWAVPSPAALDALAAAAGDGGVCEIGAGTGLWAAALRERGVRVHAYDMTPTPGSGAEHPPSTNWQHALPVDGGWLSAPAFGAVASGDAAAATRAHPRALLLMCWPPCEDDETAPASVRRMAADAIAAHAGDCVGLVVDAPWLDEDENGAQEAAGPAALAALRARGFRPASRLALPSWPGAPAQLQLWSRRASDEEAEAPRAPAACAVEDEQARPPSQGSSSAERQRAELVDRHARELDELLLALILRADGPLSRGERLVVARCRRRQGGRLALNERLALALRAMR